MDTFTIGIDFGTLSGRALLVNTRTGEELASHALDYPHGVMDRQLPDGTPLAPDWALEHPRDYLDVLRETVPRVLKDGGISPEQVVGIGVDFTSCTLIPCLADGTPLCFLPRYASRPHAYCKLWKHHAAQKQANRINETARERGEGFLSRYGGKTSSEWLLPKAWQMLEEDEALYRETDCLMEAGDWVVWQLTGRQTRSSCMAGYKALWKKGEGYPSEEFYRSLDPRLARFPQEKLGGELISIGQRAGVLTPEGADLLGLRPGIPVAAANVDAHVTVPAVKIQEPGNLLAIMGTSTCHMLISREEIPVPGICGVVEDGILPGFYGYEAGQSCVGDHFDWFLRTCLPGEYRDEAARQGKNLHVFLREKAQALVPGQSGLLALDWWNGNRSILVDADLTGLMLGMTLQTRPEEIYRALIEATAYGTRRIIQNFEENGLEVEEFTASGGISQKDPMTMQIYADVTGKPIRIAGSSQGPALGSAIFAAVAAGAKAGGYDTAAQASQRMGKLQDTRYLPNPAHQRVYEELYREYLLLHDTFGTGVNPVMKHLKELRERSVKKS